MKLRSFFPTHEPLPDNYAHSEICTFVEGTKIQKPSLGRMVTKEFQMTMSNKSLIPRAESLTHTENADADALLRSANQRLLKARGRASPRYGVFYVFYNFVRSHKTLRCTPAMAAGLTNRLWSMEDVVTLINARSEPVKARRPYKARAKQAAEIVQFPEPNGNNSN
jgi:hypothetical protein